MADFKAKQTIIIDRLLGATPKTFQEMAELGKSATEEQYSRAYKALALALHPDKGGNEDLFKLLQQLWSKRGKAEKEAPTGSNAEKTDKKYPPKFDFTYEEAMDFSEFMDKDKELYGVNFKFDVMNENGDFVGKYDMKKGSIDREAKEPKYWEYLFKEDPNHYKRVIGIFKQTPNPNNESPNTNLPPFVKTDKEKEEAEAKEIADELMRIYKEYLLDIFENGATDKQVEKALETINTTYGRNLDKIYSRSR